jgi:hypothetical protein
MPFSLALNQAGVVYSAAPAVQKPRMTWITQMGTGFVMVENLFRGHPPGEHPWHRYIFL